MPDRPARAFGPREREPRVVPGYLGVGWGLTVERALAKGERCVRCGRVGGEASPVEKGVVCLACLGMHPDDEAQARRCGDRVGVGGREDKAPPRRLTDEDRKVIGANVHGRVWLAQVDAERRGDRESASRYRLWLGLYQDRLVGERELERRAREEGI